MTGSPGFHLAASRTAEHVDAVFLFIAATSLFFFLLVEGMLVYFAIRYRRRRGEEAVATSTARGNTLLETIWIVIPSVVVIAFFAYGYVVFRDMRTPVPGALDIQVTARQFTYEFRYPDGRTSIAELRVPVGKPVKLTMTSADVIHGFFLPDYRVKQDIVPGQYTFLHLWPDRIGEYDIFCTQYCGVGHSNMRAKLVVSSEADYAAWAARREAGAVPLSQRGKELVEKLGCLGCHTVDGARKVGPTLKGLYGRTVDLEGGKKATADDDYIRESLLDPGAKIARGFPNVMPTFKTTLSDGDVTAIVSYLKVLAGKAGAEAAGPAAAGPQKGSEIAERSGCLGCHATDGSAKVGPTWKGLFGSRVRLGDGRTVVADEEYLRESIFDPSVKIVAGFPNVMPSYKGTLTEGEVAALVDYIKTLK